MVSEEQAALQASVLPLFRTRADVTSWRNVREYAQAAGEGVSALEDAVEEVGAEVVLPVLRRALRSVIGVHQRSDDSNGVIGDVVAGLLALHADLSTEVLPPLAKLVDWLVGFEFDRSWWHDFHLDIVEYADALGPVGLEQYEQRILDLQAALPVELPADQRQAAWRGSVNDPAARVDDAWEAHVRHAAARALQRVAVAREDAALIVQRIVGDGTRAKSWLAAANALVEIDAVEAAIDAAHRGAFAETSPFAERAAALWADLLEEHHPEAELPARREVFQRFPNSSTAAVLHEAAARDGEWAGLEAGVLERLSVSPRDLVLFLLLTLNDPGRAFRAAVDLQLPHAPWNDDLWDRLLDEQIAVVPASVIPVLEDQVAVLLLHADAEHYRAAAARLVVLRRAARVAGRTEYADEVIAALRHQNRIRPRLQAEFDQAGLP